MKVAYIYYIINQQFLNLCVVVFLAIRNMQLNMIFEGRPDMTFAVDWALNNNYLSIIFETSLYLKEKNTFWSVEFRQSSVRT